MKLKAIIVLISILFSSLLYANGNTPLKYDEIIKNYEGKIVYLDFWASWCTPCRRSFPWMNELKSKFNNDQFVVVSVNLDTLILNEYIGIV